MRRGLAVLAFAAMLAPGGAAVGQSPPATAGQTRPASDRVLGEVTTIDPAGKQISLKSDAGRVVTVTVDERTLYRRVPPGETNVEKATPINFAEVAVGDRVLARGKLDADVLGARVVLVVSRSEIVRREEEHQAEWQRRGLTGTVIALDPATKEITVRTREAATLQVKASGSNVLFKRYAPNSTRYRDATPSSFAELKVGDQVNALGERSEDGASFVPEEIIAGSFRINGGIITAVNVSAGEITIRDIKTRQPLTVVFSRDSVLRRLPAELLTRMEESMQRTAPPPTTPAGSGELRQEVRIVTPGMANVDYQEEIAKLPPITVADLKPGDGIIVSSPSKGDPSRVTAITLAAGVEGFLKRQEEARNARPGYQLDIGLPGLGSQ
jgi:hypothetical protein